MKTIILAAALALGSVAAGIGILFQSVRIPPYLPFSLSGRGTLISASLSSVPTTGSPRYHWVGWHRKSLGMYMRQNKTPATG